MKSFSKIQRLLKDKSNEKKAEAAQERKHWPMQPTIAYREYVYYRDPFQLALSAPDETPLPEEVERLLFAINYFGKRGGFFQLLEPPLQTQELTPGRFITLTAEHIQPFSLDGTLQMLDDCGRTLTFQRASIYSPERITLGKDRVLRHVVLPYRLLHSSRSYSWYQSLTQDE